jgi:hypothetical protein
MPPEGLVDPYIHPEHPGWNPDCNASEEGANYLRRLRGSETKGAGGEGEGKNGGGSPAEASPVRGAERRRSPRVRCSSSAKLRTEGSDLRLWGTLTDISLTGCYVEMNTTFPVGTNVNLVLRSSGIRIQVSGTVRASYPFLGMGICFTQVEPAQQLQLQQLLAMLAGHSTFTNGLPVQDAMKETLRLADPRAFLNEVAEFFRKNQVLSREEFHQIAKRVRRS